MVPFLKNEWGSASGSPLIYIFSKPNYKSSVTEFNTRAGKSHNLTSGLVFRPRLACTSSGQELAAPLSACCKLQIGGEQCYIAEVTRGELNASSEFSCMLNRGNPLLFPSLQGIPTWILKKNMKEGGIKIRVRTNLWAKKIGAIPSNNVWLDLTRYIEWWENGIPI